MENGKYRARAVAGALSQAKSGTTGVTVEFKLLDYKEEGNDFADQIYWNGWLTDNTWERTVESLRHCGWEGDDLSDLRGIDRNEVELVIANETYEGVTEPKVKWVNKAGGMGFAGAMGADEAKSFAASMRGKIAGFDATKKRPAKTGSPNGPKQSGLNLPTPPASMHGADEPPF